MAWLGLCLAVMVWGGSFIVTRQAVLQMPPLAFAVGRFTLALLGLGLAHGVGRVSLRVPRDTWAWLAISGLLGTTLTYVLENIALRFTSAGNSSLFIAASPLVSVAGAILFLGERPAWRQLLGMAIALGGMLAMVGGNVAVTGTGDLLMALNTLVGASYGLVAKKLAGRLNPLVTLTWSYVIGLVGLLPCAWLEALTTASTPWTWSPGLLISLGYLGLLSSCGAYWLWQAALRHVTATAAGIFLYLMPVWTLIFSALFLGETITPARALEATLILGGVALASRPVREVSRQDA